jgi:hypothetical protein
VVETADSYDVYRAVRSTIVPPTDVQVLDPVPGQSGATPTAAVVAILFLWVFPAVAPHLPFEDVTISSDGAAP